MIIQLPRHYKVVFLEMASCASGQCSIFVSNGYTSHFLCTSHWDRSLEAKWYQDFHQIFSHRHFNSTKWDTLFVKKIVFCRFLSVLLRIISIFYVKTLFYTLECWKTQKTASNLVSYFVGTETKFKICSFSQFAISRWNAF